MSGICGVLALDGGQISLGPILEQLEQRGPDGTHEWTERPVALGHTLLATTPEALVEVLPLSDPGSDCTITADVRLDNREELIDAFGIAGEARIIGDGELILRAYGLWGEDCPKHLLGDFAFAIWDPRDKRLFCARDHMGMRQLIYHHAPGQLFAFATEAEALVACNAVPRRINEARIADFLDNLEGIDLTSTFFEEVFRLPPAHVLTVDATGLSLRQYWELQAEPEFKLDSDQAYADAFLKVFTDAVRCRLRTSGRIGSMLSGGMDSGSVAAVATKLLIDTGDSPLQTFSAIGPSADTCIETRTIRAATTLEGLNPHFIDHSNAADQFDLAHLPRGTEPFDSHMTLVRAVYLAAHKAEINVMLDGVAGDVVLTSGNRVAQLLRHGRVIAALREARAEQRFWGTAWPSWKTFSKALWVSIVPAPLRKLRRRLAALRLERLDSGNQLMSNDLAERVNLAARREKHRQHVPDTRLSPREQRARSIWHPYMIVARERYDRLAAAYAIEPRDPFLDVRLIEFCLSLPPGQLQAEGWPKFILRRAMRDLLPAEVIWRRGKEHLGWIFTKMLWERCPSCRWEFWGDKMALDPYLAPDLLADGHQVIGKALDIETQMKLFYLGSWISRIVRQPPATNSESGMRV